MQQGIRYPALLLGIALWLAAPKAAVCSEESTVRVLFPKQQVLVTAERATSPAQQERGLMGRQEVGPLRGMLFVFAEEGPRTVWMKGMLVPLDVLFIDGAGTIVDIKENLQPCRGPGRGCPDYPSARPAKYMLEVQAGFSRRHAVHVGDKVELDPAP